MGCAFTKNLTNGSGCNSSVRANNKSGNVSNNPLEVPEPPPPDPRLPLNARQKFQITKSWKGIQRAMEPTGVSMFIKLFEENSELLNLFTKFQSLKTKESQRESMELAEHASKVMTTLDESINSLDKVDFFMDYLHAIGRDHRKIPGFKKEYFWRIERPFLTAVKDTLEDRYTENMENIYKITVHFILETLIAGYEEAESEDVNSNTKQLEDNQDATT
ncbi:neuroglobin-like [Panonychus citri]|uniref:neuroglobin-like n=1 Tax=Panonychus citri TaxID=50023 RepID=UPI00230701EB|nr:neuroglobin-like [Panonychus citri]